MNAKDEIDKLEKQAADIQLHLEALGPNHAMYVPLMNELDILKFNLAVIKDEAQNILRF